MRVVHTVAVGQLLVDARRVGRARPEGVDFRKQKPRARTGRARDGERAVGVRGGDNAVPALGGVHPQVLTSIAKNSYT